MSHIVHCMNAWLMGRMWVCHVSALREVHVTMHVMMATVDLLVMIITTPTDCTPRVPLGALVASLAGPCAGLRAC